MSNLRWQKNSHGGITLQRFVPERIETYRNTTFTYTIGTHWDSLADVYKAKHGDRYVVRIVRWNKNNERRYQQYAAFSLREAMRMAKFLVGLDN